MSSDDRPLTRGEFRNALLAIIEWADKAIASPGNTDEGHIATCVVRNAIAIGVSKFIVNDEEPTCSCGQEDCSCMSYPSKEWRDKRIDKNEEEECGAGPSKESPEAAVKKSKQVDIDFALDLAEKCRDGIIPDMGDAMDALVLLADQVEVLQVATTGLANGLITPLVSEETSDAEKLAKTLDDLWSFVRREDECVEAKECYGELRSAITALAEAQEWEECCELNRKLGSGFWIRWWSDEWYLMELRQCIGHKEKSWNQAAGGKGVSQLRDVLRSKLAELVEGRP